MEAIEKQWKGREGGCLCGAIRYRIEGPPLALVACHCTECQVRGGGPLSLSMPIASEHFAVLQGTPAVQEGRIEDRVKSSHICAACHVRLWVTNTATPGMLIIKAGTLDRCDDFHPVAHLWVRSKQPWVQLATDTIQFETQPQPSAFGEVVTAWHAQHGS